MTELPHTSKLSIVFRLLRLDHWIKNLLIFFPILFSGHLLELQLLFKAFWSFLIFSLMSSGVYILNDIQDRSIDQYHPINKKRSIANGTVSIRLGLKVSVMLIVISLGGALYLHPEFFLLLLIYFVLNLSYSYWLRNLAIVDIIVIAIGFLLRIYVGGVIGGVNLSHWLLLITFFLAIFLGLSKRRTDLILGNENQKIIRRSLEGYNLQFIDLTMTLFAGIILVSYIMYNVSPEVQQQLGSKYTYITVFPATVGIMRYLQLLYVKNTLSSPVTILYQDAVIKICVIN